MSSGQSKGPSAAHTTDVGEGRAGNPTPRVFVFFLAFDCGISYSVKLISGGPGSFLLFEVALSYERRDRLQARRMGPATKSVSCAQ
jgi:hypothetical protein